MSTHDSIVATRALNESSWLNESTEDFNEAFGEIRSIISPKPSSV